jgi:hypothetical protein
MGIERVAHPGAVMRRGSVKIAYRLLHLGREGASQAGAQAKEFSVNRVLPKGRVPLR